MTAMGLVVPFVGPLRSPLGLLAALGILLLALLVGRVLLGVAWKLVLVAMVVVLGLWAIRAVETLVLAG